MRALVADDRDDVRLAVELLLRRAGPAALDLDPDLAGRVQARFRGGLAASAALECAGACAEAGAVEHIATLFLAAWDEGARTLRYVNCAHPAPVVRRRDGRIERLRPTAFALGLFEDATPSVAETTLDAGDLLVAFTDGVVEARRDDEEFGDERLVAAIEPLAARKADEIAAGLLEAVASFAADEDRDDRAVLVARAKEARP